jgi:uncharacterized protein with HEPN domain
MLSLPRRIVLRDSGLYLQDISESCHKVQQLMDGLDLTAFAADWRTRDAVLFNLQVIGEAVKRLPEDLKTSCPDIPWRRISGFRDVLAHAYFSLDDSIVWDVASHQMSPLLGAVDRLLAGLDS